MSNEPTPPSSIGESPPLNPTPLNPTPTSTPTPRTIDPRLGWLLAAPAFLLLIVQWVWPSLKTLLISLDASRAGLPRAQSGSADLGAVIPDMLRGVGEGLTLTLPVLAIALPLGLVITWIAPRAGVNALITRVLLAVLLVLYSPTAVTIGFGDTWGRMIRESGTAGAAPVLASLLAYTPAAIAAVALAAGATFARPTRQRTFIVAALGLLASLAAAVQIFEVPFLLTTSSRKASPPALQQYTWAFNRFNFADGAAFGVLMLVLVAVLSVAAMLLLLRWWRTFATPEAYLATPVAPAAHAGTSARPQFARTDSPFGIVGMIVALLVVVAAIIVLLPVFQGWTNPAPSAVADPTRGLITMWVPTLGAALITVVVSAAAGLGIGWFAPLGARSPLLLLAFAPWLLATRSSLQLVDYLSIVGDAPGGSVVKLLGPSLVSPVIVTVTTILFALTRMRGVTPATARNLGVVGLLALLSWVGGAMGLAWPLVSAARTQDASSVFTLVYTTRVGRYVAPPTWMALPPQMLVLTLVLACAALWAIGITRPRRPRPQPIAGQPTQTEPAQPTL